MANDKAAALAAAVIGAAAVGGAIYYLTKKPPAPEEKGTLVVDTTPIKGSVYLDDKFVGVAPVTLTLAIGTYTVSFGDVSGYETPEPKTVTIEAGEVSSVIGVYTEITTPPPSAIGLTIDVEPTTVEEGGIITVSGTLTEDGKWLEGKSIEIYLDNKLIKTVTTDPLGFYVYSFNITGVGTHYIKTRYAEENVYSDTVQVEVTEKIEYYSVFLDVAPIELRGYVEFQVDGEKYLGGSEIKNIESGTKLTVTVTKTEIFRPEHGDKWIFKYMTINGTTYNTTTATFTVTKNINVVAFFARLYTIRIRAYANSTEVSGFEVSMDTKTDIVPCFFELESGTYHLTVPDEILVNGTKYSYLKVVEE